MRKVSLDEETYWKLVNIKARLKCRTWRELADRLLELVEKAL